MSPASQLPNSLAQSDVREVLQYVPIFRGKTFLVALDGQELSDTVMAEILLDLIALQNIGVKLVLAYVGQAQDELLDWSMEVELKLSEATEETVLTVLSRGQAALVGISDQLAFDTSLVQLALQAEADKILFLGDPRAYPTAWQGALNLSDAQGALSPGGARDASHAAVAAVVQGVPRVHLLDGAMPGCLSRELFSNEGVGIMIYTDSYQEIRSITQEDIPELLAIIGRSVRAQHLLPRNYEEVEAHMQDYYVMCIDGNVVGCVAVHPYGSEICELACLFVKESHKGLGYGHALVTFAEGVATDQGYRQIFALSTDAGGFFERQLRYSPVPLTTIPVTRQEKLAASGRASNALLKNLPATNSHQRHH